MLQKLPKKLLLIFCVASSFCTAQNLVPNGSFEQLKSLPCSTFVPSVAAFDSIAKDWFLPTHGTSDIFTTLVDSSCLMHANSTSLLSLGSQQPHGGQAMAAAILYSNFSSGTYREYLSIQLAQPLEIGKEYAAEMFLSLVDKNQMACNRLGFYFSSKSIENLQGGFDGVLLKPAQIEAQNVISSKTDWVKVSGTFVADSAYKFLTIGNFAHYDSVLATNRQYLTSYYFIDDISVVNNCLSITGDTSICQGELAEWQALSAGSVWWVNPDEPNNVLSTDSTFSIAPESTTTFWAISDCDTLEFTIEVRPKPILQLPEKAIFCEGDTATFDAGHDAPGVMWSTGSTQRFLQVYAAGKYWVRVEKNGCVAFDTVEMHYFDFEVKGENEVCAGDSIMLFGPNVGQNFLWSTGHNSSQIWVNAPGEYWLQVKNGNCILADTILVNAKKCPSKVFIPNAFTPNGDGNNDWFFPVFGTEISGFEMQIFNRWGDLVFEGTLSGQGWDGTFRGRDCATGYYVYHLEYYLPSGKTEILNGGITLLR